MMDAVASSDPVQALQDVTPNAVADQLNRCRYPGKICRNTRVAKANGSLHRYCAYHRKKANLNQKRWVDRQRASSPTASSSSSSGTTSPSASGSSVYAGRYYRWIMAANPINKLDKSAPSQLNLVPKIIINNKPKVPEPTPADDANSTNATTLSEDDWNGLLAILCNDTDMDSLPEDAFSTQTFAAASAACH